MESPPNNSARGKTALRDVVSARPQPEAGPNPGSESGSATHTTGTQATSTHDGATASQGAAGKISGNTYGATPGSTPDAGTPIAAESTDTAVPVRAEHWAGFGAALIGLLAAGAESALVYGRLYYDLPYLWLVGGHVVIVLALTGWIYAITRRGGDTSLALLTTLAIAAMGPLGGLVSVAAGISTPVQGETTPLLREWYERISHSVRVDPVTKHCDMVAIGRALDLAGAPPPSFTEAIDKGTLLQKQNALGLIARKFHPNYLPALKAALKSSEPVIRVQAAAVAAHVRDDVTGLLQQMQKELRDFQAETDPGNVTDARPGLRLIAQIENCLSSGLLDEKDRNAGRLLVDNLGAGILDGLEAARATGSDIDKLLESDLEIESIAPGWCENGAEADRVVDWGAGGAPELVYAEQLAFDRARDCAALKQTYERLLLQHGRFDQFRLRRFGHADITPGLWRVRRLREVHP